MIKVHGKRFEKESAEPLGEISISYPNEKFKIVNCDKSKFLDQ